jgi:FMN hydrolase / 5-amino-6-(5-phospho-D-ribitylamino)uracil phosphatase
MPAQTHVKPIKAVLFDLDDTLWPIVPVIAHAEEILYDWLALHAPNVVQRFTVDSLRERRRMLATTAPHYTYDLNALRKAALMEAFIECNEDIAKIDTAMAIFSHARNKVTPFDDVMPVLLRLGKTVAVGSVSNGAADLQAIGLAHHFRISVAAHQLGCSKPDAAIFHAACDALGVTPAETAYVGDDPALDVEGAQKAGLHGIWVNRFQRAMPDHIRPDAVCKDFYELEQWLARHLGP